MAGRFIELKEAAKMLGVTPDELVEMRSSGEIHGYRDGASWKFKSDEVERLLAERGAGTKGDSGSLEDELDELIDVRSFDDEESDEGSGSSILVSEEALGQSDETTSSTVIGKGERGPDVESDIKLSPTPSDLQLAESGVGSDVEGLSGSDVSLVPDTGAESDVKLVATGSDELKLTPQTDTGDLPGGGSSGGSDFELSDDDEFALSDDDDLVLSAATESGVGSDVTLGSQDSGINLASPTDSGLSLEDEPLDLAGASSSGSLELPEDDDIISLDEEFADADEPTQLQQDEEFLLSPSDEASVDESDSGSQVIALEDSEAFDADAATMVQPAPDMGLVVEEGGLETEPFGAVAPAAAPAAAAGVAPSIPAHLMPRELPEASYSVWNVSGLMAIVLILGMTGMLMTDVCRNIWSWNGSSGITTSLMDMFVKALGL